MYLHRHVLQLLPLHMGLSSKLNIVFEIEHFTFAMHVYVQYLHLFLPGVQM